MAMKSSSVYVVLLVVILLLLGLGGNLWADACYALQGKVKRSDTGQYINGVSIYVNGVYQGQTLNSNLNCGSAYSGNGCYKIEADASGINLCSKQNNVGGEINIGGTWYRGGGKCVWVDCGDECPPCGRFDFDVVPNGSMPPSDWSCPQSTNKGGSW